MPAFWRYPQVAVDTQVFLDAKENNYGVAWRGNRISTRSKLAELDIE
jgi:hypothetical protein